MIILLHLLHACIYAMQLLSDFLIPLLISFFSVVFLFFPLSHILICILGFCIMFLVDYFIAYLSISVYHLCFVGFD